jgi:hypothetical protein
VCIVYDKHHVNPDTAFTARTTAIARTDCMLMLRDLNSHIVKDAIRKG